MHWLHPRLYSLPNQDQEKKRRFFLIFANEETVESDLDVQYITGMAVDVPTYFDNNGNQPLSMYEWALSQANSTNPAQVTESAKIHSLAIGAL